MTTLKITGFCFFLICELSVHGRHDADSTAWIDSLNATAIIYTDAFKPREALSVANEALRAANEKKYSEGIAQSEYVIGKALAQQNLYAEALDHLGRSILEYQKLKNFKGIIKVINEKGNIFWGIGKYDKYLEEHLESLNLSQKYNYQPGIIDSYISLGSTYAILNNFQEAINYYRKSLNLAGETEDILRLALVHNELGKLYEDYEHYDSAERFFNQSYALSSQIQDINGKARATHSLGQLYYKKGDYENALRTHLAAKKLIDEIDNKRAVAIIYNSLGLTYYKLGNSSLAVKYLKKGVLLGREVGIISNEAEAAELLSKIYQSNGNYKEALFYHQYFKGLSDDINQKLKVSELARLEMQFKHDKERQEMLFDREQENLRNFARIEQQKVWLYQLIGGIVFLLTISIFIFIYHRFKQRTTKGLLRERQYKIDKLNNEMEELIYRTSHDLKAPIATILGITNLVSRTATPEQVPYFKMIESTIKKQEKVIRDIADISKNENLRVVREQIDFKALVDEALMTYKNGYDNIEVNTNINIEQPFYSDKERIKIIINNLVSNAISFRDVHKEEKPRVDIIVDCSESECLLKVSDNGVGIDKLLHNRVYDMFFRGEELSNGSGLGLYVTKNTVQKLRGKINLESIKKVGTSFKVILPNLN